MLLQRQVVVESSESCYGLVAVVVVEAVEIGA